MQKERNEVGPVPALGGGDVVHSLQGAWREHCLLFLLVCCLLLLRCSRGQVFEHSNSWERMRCASSSSSSSSWASAVHVVCPVAVGLVGIAVTIGVVVGHVVLFVRQ